MNAVKTEDKEEACKYDAELKQPEAVYASKPCDELIAACRADSPAKMGVNSGAVPCVCVNLPTAQGWFWQRLWLLSKV